MNFIPSDSKLLNLWQKLHFEAECHESSPSQKADSLRGILNQISHLYSNGNISQVGYCRLIRQYADKYCRIIDSQDMNNGLNNFAEPVLSLVTGHRNDSSNWESSLTLDAIKNTKMWNDIIKRNQELNLPKNSELPKDQGLPDSTGILHKISTAPKTSSNISWKEHFPIEMSAKPDSCEGKRKEDDPGVMATTSYEESNILSNKRKLHFVYSNERNKFNNVQPRDGTSRQPSNSNMVSGQQHNSLNPGTSRSTLFEQTQGPNPTHSNRVIPSKGNTYNSEQTYRDQNQSKFGRNNDDDDFQERAKPSKFITAKQQYIIDCKTKNQRGGGRPSNRGASNDRLSCNSSNSYGAMSRRTLGTRRGPGSKFIPPIQRGGSDDEAMESTSVNRKRGFEKNNEDMNDGIEPEMDERLKSIEPKMVELIMNEIMDHGPPITWDDIAGLEFAKNVIKEIVVWPMLRPDIFKGLRGPPKGLLLFGPPGTGKTLIGKCIASQSKATFFSISASSLTSKWVGEGEKMVRALFAVARCYLPAVIFIDEIDSLLTQRTDGEHEASRRIKTEFLVQLDGATTNTDERLLVVGATNRPQEIDEAARRRLVKRLYIPLPDSNARLQIIKNLLSQQNYNLTEQEISLIVTRSEGYSGSDMSNLCREAAIGPIRCIATADIEHITADQVRPIEFKDFDAALSQVRASVSQKDLDTYIEWNTLFGSGSK